MKKPEFMTLFEEWNSALQTGDPDQVVSLYAEDAILLPTMSNKVRHNREEIKDYFTRFILKKPVGKIVELNMKLKEKLLLSSGIYEFTFGSGESVSARFTFVHEKKGGIWKIIEHHSSLMPE